MKASLFSSVSKAMSVVALAAFCSNPILASAASPDSTAVTSPQTGTLPSHDKVLSPSHKVKLQMGTMVELAFDQPMSAEGSTLGQMVNLRVTMPVVVDGDTLISTNSMAVAEVTNTSKSGAVGKGGELQIMARQVTAVDGTIVPLSGYKTVVGEGKVGTSVIVAVLCCILGLLIKGEKAEIPAGATFRVAVAAPVDISVSSK